MSNTWWRDEGELIKEQLDLLDIPIDESVLIEGPPGSGKTNLLLLRANQIFVEHPNLHVVVFGSLLKNFMRIGGAQYKFPEDRIVTLAHLFTSILRSEGRDFDSTKMDHDEARKERWTRVRELIDTKKIGKLYECLLLDEAQDCSPEEIEIFFDLTDVVVATADIKQKVYDVPDCIDGLRSKISRKHPLKYHFRNGLDICRVADGIMVGKPGYNPMAATSQYKNNEYPCRVYHHPSMTLEKQASEMAKLIKDQLFAYPDDIIGVMCPKNEDLNAIAAQFAKEGLGDLITRANSSGFDASMPIWMSTLAAAKGLEFRAAHIGGLEHLSRMGGLQKRLIFTGTTRAKTTLSFYWNESCPGYLHSAIAALAPASPPTKKQIFGKV